MPRLRELTEEECYWRCYGRVGDDREVVVRPRPDPDARQPEPGAAERVREAFEERLDGREPEAA